MEGPQFSSLAESEMHRGLKCDVVGMTNMPEAKLAREAELCYATLALVTDYDVWHEEEEPVTVEMVVERLRTNAAAARALIQTTVAALPVSRSCACARALEGALITDPSVITPEARERLRPLTGRYLKESR
jgi:5'-methylthioadenosine phosphorylase